MIRRIGKEFKKMKTAKNRVPLVLALVICFSLLTVTALAADDDFKINDGVLEDYTGNDSVITIPDGVTSIGRMAFYECNSITSVTMPDSVTSIGSQAFTDCTKLESITMSRNLTSIGNMAFHGCESLKSITIPNGVTSLNDYVFWRCKSLSSITIGSGVTSIGTSTFTACASLVSVTLPANLKTIGDYAFNNTGLTSITIPSGVTSIGMSAFFITNITNVTIPSSVTTFGTTPFAKSVTIYCVAGSAAEKFAKERVYDYVLITEIPEVLVAKPTASTVLVNGQVVAFDAYNINDNNYFKLRDLAYILNGSEKQFAIGWDGANNAISLTSGQAYEAVGGEMTGKGAGDKTPTPTSSRIYLDGSEVQFTAYNIEDNNYFKLRDVGAAFDFGVDWDGANNTIVIDTSKGYTPG